jgi:hypothetical protein
MRLFAGLEDWKIGSVGEDLPSFRFFQSSIHLTILLLYILR